MSAFSYRWDPTAKKYFTRQNSVDVPLLEGDWLIGPAASRVFSLHLPIDIDIYGITLTLSDTKALPTSFYRLLRNEDGALLLAASITTGNYGGMVNFPVPHYLKAGQALQEQHVIAGIRSYLVTIYYRQAPLTRV